MIEHYQLSDRGRTRRNNQDSIKSEPDFGLYLLADGMGGHAAGGVASRLVVETIAEFVGLAMGKGELTWPFGYKIHESYHHNILRTSVQLANSRVCQQAEQTDSYAGMGTTLVAVMISENRAFYTHVGDSRLYRLRAGALQQLTEDHSLVQEQLKMGLIEKEQIPTHALRHVVIRAIGSRQPLEFDIVRAELQNDDVLLLCCDGLTDSIDDRAIASIIEEADDLEQAGRNLIDSANQAGGEDNISVVLVAYRGD